MKLRSSDLKSDGDLDSIRNSCDVSSSHSQIMILSLIVTSGPGPLNFFCAPQKFEGAHLISLLCLKGAYLIISPTKGA